MKSLKLPKIQFHVKNFLIYLISRVFLPVLFKIFWSAVYFVRSINPLSFFNSRFLPILHLVDADASAAKKSGRLFCMCGFGKKNIAVFFSWKKNFANGSQKNSSPHYYLNIVDSLFGHATTNTCFVISTIYTCTVG